MYFRRVSLEVLRFLLACSYFDNQIVHLRLVLVSVLNYFFAPVAELFEEVSQPLRNMFLLLVLPEDFVELVKRVYLPGAFQVDRYCILVRLLLFENAEATSALVAEHVDISSLAFL
jgi:hypothetical protein